MAVRYWRRSSSGRSDVYSHNGLVATSQPLASSTGIQMLRNGGSAADAIIAMASVLNVVEPYSTGIGGDAFALIFIPGETKPKAINGSGYSPENLSFDYLTRERGLDQIPSEGLLSITVPGAVSAWEMIHNKYGKLSWEDVLQPAIEYARNGFPVSPIIAQVWNENVPKLLKYEGAKRTYLVDEERSPIQGENFIQKSLASTLEIIAGQGAEAFYKGELANQIVRFFEHEGGYVQDKDLSDFTADWTEPICMDFFDRILWEHGPNGQGIVTLMILSIAEELDIGRYTPFSPDYFHYLIEAKKMAFADAFAQIADPNWMKISPSYFLSDQYAQTRASQVNPLKALQFSPPPLQMGNDTVYLTAVDKEGFAISFVNSLFDAFGSGIVDPQTGIAFQSRGSGFSLIKGDPNQFEPRKRPFHTIIPAMVTSSENEFIASFGVMGGHHQPQGQAQVFLNMVLHGMNPQEALDKPRFHHNQFSNTLAIETPVEIGVRTELRRRGHQIEDCVGTNFGGGQIIMRNSSTGSYIAGSDPRKDGQALGY